MKRQISFQEYRGIDLFLLAIVMCFTEFIIIQASSRWFVGQPFTVSVAAAMTAIVYMRWSGWGAIHAALAGLIFCLFYGGTLNQYMIYIVGNLFSLPAVLMLEKLGYEKVREDSFLSLFFPALVWFLMQTGRAVISLLLGALPGSALGFFTTDSLSLLFTLLVVWVARRLDGVYENQKHYLLRIHEDDE